MIRFATVVFALAAGLLAAPAGAQVQYIHTDALGSVVAVTDANRNVIDRREFAPYGDQLNAPAADRGPGYTGHVEDGLTGLTYMQQRYYDPAIGRFLSVDPVGPLEDPLNHFGRYHYAYNNPYRYTDPDGMCPICPILWAIGVGGTVGAGTSVVAQKALNPDAPINKVEVAVSAVAGSVSGGTGGALVGAVARGGAMTVPRAIAAQTVVNAATGGGSVVAQGAIEGNSVSGEQIAIGTFGSAAGGLIPSAIGVAAGDFAAAAKQGLLARMANSSAPGSQNIASTTLSTGNAIAQQSSMQAMGSQTGQAVAGAGAAIQQKKIEEKLK